MKLINLELDRRVALQTKNDALDEVRTLSGMLPTCAHCRKIRHDVGYWNQIEAYLPEHADVVFSHGICPECAKTLYSELKL